MSALVSALGLRESIRNAALAAGFARVGFAPATLEPAAEAAALTALHDWLARGYAGELTSYLREGADGRARPETLLPGVRTVIAVLLRYGAAPSPPGEGAVGRVARYARGADYHVVIHRRLRELAGHLPRLAGRPVRWRITVDTAPLLERAFATAAGLGFVGKNQLLIAPGLGSYTVLGELLVDLELPADQLPADQLPAAGPQAAGPQAARLQATGPQAAEPQAAGPQAAEPQAAESQAAGSARTAGMGCGQCRACLDACPTGALVAPSLLDARRCLAYLTISAGGPLPRELRSALGARVFGCDACQEACPFNRGADPVGDPELAVPPEAAALRGLPLVRLLGLRAKEHRRLTRGTALWRHPRALLQRNAAVALGNSGDRAAVAPLGAALRHGRFALVRGHAAWALGRLGEAAARALLSAARRAEPDAAVAAEIEAALEDGGG